MRNKLLLLSVLALLSISNLFGQTGNNVGIGTNTPEKRALLDLSSTDKGFLVPRMLKADRKLIDTVTTPADIRGMMVYDLDDKLFYYFDGVRWQNLVPGYAVQKWSAKGSTDISISTATFALMTDMTLNVTPRQSTVYVNFSASGDVSPITDPQYVQFRCKVNGVVVGGTTSIATDMNAPEVASAWNAQLVLPVTVNPGVANTIEIEWFTDNSNNTPSTVRNDCATKLNYSHRTLIVTE